MLTNARFQMLDEPVPAPEETPPAEPAPAPEETPPAEPASINGHEQQLQFQPLSSRKLDAMWEMATMEAPVNDDTFTPAAAIDIIMVTRNALAVAVQEIARLINQPEGHGPENQERVIASLAERFAERNAPEYVNDYMAKQFVEDGGMWTVFHKYEHAIAFVPDRDAAVALVNTLSGLPLPTPDETAASSPEGGPPDTVADPVPEPDETDPEDNDPEGGSEDAPDEDDDPDGDPEDEDDDPDGNQDAPEDDQPVPFTDKPR